MRGEQAIGAIVVTRREPGRFSDRQVTLLRTFAAQAVIAIENVRLFKELEARNADLTEALDRQTGTAEILRVISSSPTDVQPVFDAIVTNAVRLCGGVYGMIWRYEGDLVDLVGVHNLPAEGREQLVGRFPRLLDTLVGPLPTALRTGNVVEIPDVSRYDDPDGRMRELWRTRGVRSVVMVPMRREGAVVGVIGVSHPEVGALSANRVELLKTFANQAVIAIENVRLFKELEARNRDLTATGEILQVISRSPTDAQPVFDTIADNAVKLFRPWSAAVYRFDGEFMHVAAVRGGRPGSEQYLREQGRRHPTRDVMAGRCIIDRSVIHVPDFETDPDVPMAAREIARLRGFRATINVPMLRDGEPIGVISVSRAQTGAFSQAEIDLLQTFADQAAIAIENVRLFKELEARNAELTDSLARQTATGEVLGAISRAQTDAQPVFDIIAKSVQRLCAAGYGQVALYDGALLHMTAFHDVNPEGVEALRRRFPAPADRGSAMGRALQTRAVVQIPDVLGDPAYIFKSELQTMGFQSLLVVPMLRKDEPIGAIAVGRPERGPFPDKQIELLKTFADQAVIAIENVRLFNELQARTSDLTRSVGELTALGEVGRALSSTLDLETVLQTIVARANQLTGTAGCTIWEYDEPREEFRLRVSHYADEPDAALLQAPGRVTTIRKGQGVTTQVVELRQPVQIHDIAAEGAYESPIRGPLIEAGHRALLGVPLLREDEVIGVLAVTRKTPGEFEPEVVQLLSTFATQSALAIQRAAVPGDRRQEPSARDRQPAQVRISRQHVARAADATQRRYRLLRGAVGADVR